MKNVFISLVVTVFLSLSVSGQNYNFQVLSGTYSDLTGETSLSQGQLWDDPDFIVPIGFSFPFWGKQRNTIYVTDGVCSFDPDFDTIVAPYLVDMIDRGYMGSVSQSPISYKNEMVGGINVFKLEFRNFGFFMESSELGTLNWYGNVQLWLYENGTWEVHIGPSMIGDPFVAFWEEDGPAIGYGHITKNYWLTGMADNPTMTSFSSPYVEWMSSVPADGRIYRFEDPTSSIARVSDNTEFAVYPNPVSTQLGLTLPEGGTVELFDLAGKRVMARSYNAEGKYSIELGTLAKGTYIVSLTTDSGGRASKRIIKQ